MEMRTPCEICNKELQNDGIAYICSHECTYCEAFATKIENICPNCKGELVRRPGREKKTITQCTQ